MRHTQYYSSHYDTSKNDENNIIIQFCKVQYRKDPILYWSTNQVQMFHEGLRHGSKRFTHLSKRNVHITISQSEILI